MVFERRSGPQDSDGAADFEVVRGFLAWTGYDLDGEPLGRRQGLVRMMNRWVARVIAT